MVGKIAFVGVGAVGSYYGLMLKKAGDDVHFLLRSNYDAVKKNGFELVHHRPTKKSERIYDLNIYKDAGEIGICDWVVIANKTSVNHQIADIVQPMVGDNTSLLSLQNGMGNVERLADSLGHEREIMGGLCFTCINRTTPRTIESLLPGYVQFGQLGKKLSDCALDMVNRFLQSGVHVKKSDSLDEALWKKLCWNIPFNGLSIVGGGITTDLILKNLELKSRAEKLMIEIQSTAKFYNVQIEDAFLQRQFILTEPMGAYQPSSLIDFLNGKVVEVESIWGEPLRRGKEVGIKMPELESLYTELKEITVN
jgi:2-dehydropantoate 2-reductase